MQHAEEKKNNNNNNGNHTKKDSQPAQEQAHGHYSVSSFLRWYFGIWFVGNPCANSEFGEVKGHTLLGIAIADEKGVCTARLSSPTPPIRHPFVNFTGS